MLIAPLFSVFAGSVDPSPINPHDTFVLQPNQIQFKPWQGLPPSSGEMSMLYGDLDKSGPYLVLMKWNPGWFSAPGRSVVDAVVLR